MIYYPSTRLWRILLWKPIITLYKRPTSRRGCVLQSGRRERPLVGRWRTRGRGTFWREPFPDEYSD